MFFTFWKYTHRTHNQIHKQMINQTQIENISEISLWIIMRLKFPQYTHCFVSNDGKIHQGILPLYMFFVCLFVHLLVH